ncbi:MAG: hypothetical protein PHY31_08480, partial [Smithellaceae bacterium]|nr:hypothetical protein [Smithellaceae bacterium]
MKKIIRTPPASSEPSLKQLLELISRDIKVVRIGGLRASAKALLLALLFGARRRTVLVVAADAKEARDLHRDLTFFLGEGDALLYSAFDIVSTDLFALQREAEFSRIEVLSRFWSGRPAVITTSFQALMQKTIPKRVFDDFTHTISIGDYLDRDELAAKLDSGGYHRSTLVEEEGEFSLRGNIIDLFPPQEENPLRLEFVGDELESIRRFDVNSQRSRGEIVEFTLFPVRELILTQERRDRAARNIRSRCLELELTRSLRDRLLDAVGNGLTSSINPIYLPLFYEGPETESSEALGSLFDFLPAGCLLVHGDRATLVGAAEGSENDVDRFLLRAREEGRFHLDREAFLTDSVEAMANFERYTRLQTDDVVRPAGVDAEVPEVWFEVRTDLGPAVPLSRTDREGMLHPLAEKVKGWLHQGESVYFLCSGPEE